MPTFKVTVKEAKSIWKTPDGQRELFEVVMDCEGQEVKAKSWSGAVATVGFTGEVETYEKQGKQGVETFVRQAPKEGGYAGSGYRPQSTGGGRPAYRDNSDGQRQGMCINNATLSFQNEGFDDDEEWAKRVHARATALYQLGDLKSDEQTKSESDESQDNTVAEVTGDEDQASLLDDIKDTFPGTTDVTPEKKWPKN